MNSISRIKEGIDRYRETTGVYPESLLVSEPMKKWLEELCESLPSAPIPIVGTLNRNKKGVHNLTIFGCKVKVREYIPEGVVYLGTFDERDEEKKEQ